jgi:hypothetical protein
LTQTNEIFLEPPTLPLRNKKKPFMMDVKSVITPSMVMTIFQQSTQPTLVHQLLIGDQLQGKRPLDVPPTTHEGSPVAIWPKDKTFQPVQLVRQSWLTSRFASHWIGKEVIVTTKTHNETTHSSATNPQANGIAKYGNGPTVGICLAMDQTFRSVTLLIPNPNKSASDVVVLHNFDSIRCNGFSSSLKPANAFVEYVGKPTSNTGRETGLELAYTCSGISWSVAYNLIRLPKNEMGMSRMFTVHNECGMEFQNPLSVRLTLGKFNSSSTTGMRRSRRSMAFDEADEEESEDAPAAAPRAMMARAESKKSYAPAEQDQEFRGEMLMQEFTIDQLPVGAKPCNVKPQITIRDVKYFYEYVVNANYGNSTPRPLTFGAEWKSAEVLAPGEMQMFEANDRDGDRDKGFCLRTPLGQGRLDRMIPKDDPVTVLFGQSARVLIGAETTSEHAGRQLTSTLTLQWSNNNNNKLTDPLRLLIPIPYQFIPDTKVSEPTQVFRQIPSVLKVDYIEPKDSPQYPNMIRYDISQANPKNSLDSKLVLKLAVKFVSESVS